MPEWTSLKQLRDAFLFKPVNIFLGAHRCQSAMQDFCCWEYLLWTKTRSSSMYICGHFLRGEIDALTLLVNIDSDAPERMMQSGQLIGLPRDLDLDTL